MAVKTIEEQLESVQAAIETIELKGQSYTIADHQLSRADLPALYAREERLLAQLARQQRGGIRVRRVTPL